MSTTVHVQGISSQTSEKEVRDFFSFCGKISTLSVTPESDSTDSSQSATVTFEKETAAKTALLLDNTQLGPAQVHVSSAKSLDQISGGKSASAGEESSDDHISQEDKPRARIVAEYLAHGYVISDKAIERAIQFDQQNGVSNRFMNALNGFDQKYKVSEKAGQADSKYGVTERATQVWQGFGSYFDKVAGTPTGQRVRSFYDVGQKQVLDVHNEAKHLAGLKSGKSNMTNVPGTDKTKCNCGADTGKCPCAPGTCACANCAKNPDEKTTDVTPESAEMEKVEGTQKTKCNCGGADGKCPCEAGKCACAGCSKAS